MLDASVHQAGPARAVNIPFSLPEVSTFHYSSTFCVCCGSGYKTATVIYSLTLRSVTAVACSLGGPALIRLLPHASKVLFLAPSVTFIFLCVSNVSWTNERICAKFTLKTCLVPRSDEFECQGQRSRSPGTKDALSSPVTPPPAAYTNGMRSLQTSCSGSGRHHSVPSRGGVVMFSSVFISTQSWRSDRVSRGTQRVLYTSISAETDNFRYAYSEVINRHRRRHLFVGPTTVACTYGSGDFILIYGHNKISIL